MAEYVCIHCKDIFDDYTCDHCHGGQHFACKECHDELKHGIIVIQNANIGGNVNNPNLDSIDNDPDAWMPAWRNA